MEKKKGELKIKWQGSFNPASAYNEVKYNANAKLKEFKSSIKNKDIKYIKNEKQEIEKRFIEKYKSITSQNRMNMSIHGIANLSTNYYNTLINKEEGFDFYVLELKLKACDEAIKKLEENSNFTLHFVQKEEKVNNKKTNNKKTATFRKPERLIIKNSILKKHKQNESDKEKGKGWKLGRGSERSYNMYGARINQPARGRPSPTGLSTPYSSWGKY